jgi:uncharacterized protein DUF4242
MPQYLIERRIPGAGVLTPEQLHDISATSNGVLQDLQGQGSDIRWLHSYVTGDAIHCVYEAPNPEAVQEHARCGGFPADAIMEIKAIIDPATGQ